MVCTGASVCVISLTLVAMATSDHENGTEHNNGMLSCDTHTNFKLKLYSCVYVNIHKERAVVVSWCTLQCHYRNPYTQGNHNNARVHTSLPAISCLYVHIHVHMYVCV